MESLTNRENHYKAKEGMPTGMPCNLYMYPLTLMKKYTEIVQLFLM